MRKLVLASKSPRREELLRKLGFPFAIDPSDCDESSCGHVTPRRLVETLSLQKAKDVASRHRNAVVIAADTVVVVDNEIFGKPKGDGDAERMLARMSGRQHVVITAYTVTDSNTAKTVCRSVQTKVRFRPLSRDEIADYVRTGEPLDKAGAYGIQGRGVFLVERIEGDYSNVVGLPLCALGRDLADFGISVLNNNHSHTPQREPSGIQRVSHET